MDSERSPDIRNAPMAPTSHNTTPCKAKTHSVSSHSCMGPIQTNNTHYIKFWADRVRSNGFVYAGTIEKFLESYVPGEKPTAPCPPNLFARYKIKKGAEDCIGMVECLDALMEDIEEERRMQFAVTKDTVFKPIFNSEHTTKPDVAGTYPGNVLPSTWTWNHCPIDIEIKSKPTLDPIDEKRQFKNTLDSHDTLAQIAKNGRNILAASGACFCFVIGVYAKYARIYRFDHAGVVISPKFDIKSNSEIMFEFFWRLVHPPTINLSMEGFPTTAFQPKLLGLDITVTTPTNEEKIWLKATLEEHHSGFLNENPNRDKGERNRAPGYAKYAKKILAKRGTKLEWCFTVGTPLWHSSGLFSRATKVVRVLFKEEPSRFYALKDTWRHVYRQCEVDFYKRINEHYDEESYPTGLARASGGVDFGGHMHRSTGYLTSSVPPCSHPSEQVLETHEEEVEYDIPGVNSEDEDDRANEEENADRYNVSKNLHAKGVSGHRQSLFSLRRLPMLRGMRSFRTKTQPAFREQDDISEDDQDLSSSSVLPPQNAHSIKTRSHRTHSFRTEPRPAFCEEDGNDQDMLPSPREEGGITPDFRELSPEPMYLVSAGCGSIQDVDCSSNSPLGLPLDPPPTDSSGAPSVASASSREGSDSFDVQEGGGSSDTGDQAREVEAEHSEGDRKQVEELGKTEAYDLNRSLTRTTLYPVGRPLVEFKTTKQLVEAIKDAIAGHQKLKECGILHRDISASNVLLFDGNAYSGFLHDLDYSALLEGTTSNSKVPWNLKERTGTFQFMAIGVLEGEVHNEKHDLESFFWLLTWIVYRHVGQVGITSYMFDDPNPMSAAGLKYSYLFRSNPNVKGNPPFTWLLRRLASLLTRKQRVTHETFLEAFDLALKMKGWPAANDGPKLFVPQSSDPCYMGGSSLASLSSNSKRPAGTTVGNATKRLKTSMSTT